MLLSFVFGDSDEGIHLHARYDGKLFNLARLLSKTKVREVLTRDILFADDAALNIFILRITCSISLIGSPMLAKRLG